MTEEAGMMSAPIRIQTSPLGESKLIHTLALALPSCVNTGEGWLCPEGSGSMEEPQ